MHAVCWSFSCQTTVRLPRTDTLKIQSVKPVHWFGLALLNFMIAALLGITLRYVFIAELPWLPPYRYMLLAHSHVVMLGWVNQALLVVLLLVYLGEKAFRNRFYVLLLGFHQLAVFIMLVGFLVAGYGILSIIGTTLQGLLSYAFMHHFYRDVRHLENRAGLKWIFGALCFQFIALLGIWMIALTMVGKIGKTALYYESVQFYLHYLINGWFTFAVLAIAARWLPDAHYQGLNKSWIWLTTSCLLTFALAVTWANPRPWIFWVNSFGVLFQLVALYYLMLWFRQAHRSWRPSIHRITHLLLILLFIAFFLKMMVQTAVMVPLIAKVAYTVRNFVIAFLHLIFLGFLSLFLLAFAIQNKWLSPCLRSLQWGLGLFIAGILSSELMLFSQGIMQWAAWGFMPYFYELLFAFSALLPLGLAILTGNYLVNVLSSIHKTEP